MKKLNRLRLAPEPQGQGRSQHRMLTMRYSGRTRSFKLFFFSLLWPVQLSMFWRCLKSEVRGGLQDAWRLGPVTLKETREMCNFLAFAVEASFFPCELSSALSCFSSPPPNFPLLQSVAEKLSLRPCTDCAAPHNCYFRFFFGSTFLFLLSSVFGCYTEEPAGVSFLKHIQSAAAIT